jgi:hypothetical protein
MGFTPHFHHIGRALAQASRNASELSLRVHSSSDDQQMEGPRTGPRSDGGQAGRSVPRCLARWLKAPRCVSDSRREGSRRASASVSGNDHHHRLAAVRYPRLHDKKKSAPAICSLAAPLPHEITVAGRADRGSSDDYIAGRPTTSGFA